MQFLEGLLASWVEYEGKVQGLQAWLNAQEDRLKRKHRIENLSSVQNALKDCQVCLFDQTHGLILFNMTSVSRLSPSPEYRLFVVVYVTGDGGDGEREGERAGESGGTSLCSCPKQDG